jgi:hypothetical protein
MKRKKIKKLDKIAELEKRIEELEKRTSYISFYLPPTYNPPHYHMGQPCWNNPCVWN